MAARSVLGSARTLTTIPEQVTSARTLTPQVLTPESRPGIHLQFVGEGGKTVRLPDELLPVVATLRAVREGGSITVGSMPEELTTTAAADLLGISRTTLMKIVRRGQLPFHKVGTHTRLKASDVLVLRERRRAAQRRAARKLLDLGEQLDMHN